MEQEEGGGSERVQICLFVAGQTLVIQHGTVQGIVQRQQPAGKKSNRVMSAHSDRLWMTEEQSAERRERRRERERDALETASTNEVADSARSTAQHSTVPVKGGGEANRGFEEGGLIQVARAVIEEKSIEKIVTEVDFESDGSLSVGSGSGRGRGGVFGFAVDARRRQERDPTTTSARANPVMRSTRALDSLKRLKRETKHYGCWRRSMEQALCCRSRRQQR